MKILYRSKKKEMQGFKNFVISMETSVEVKRKERFILGMLEDPIYMEWVSKNVLHLPAILEIESKEFQTLLSNLSNSMKVLVMAFHGHPLEKKLLEVLPQGLRENYHYEVDLIKNITHSEQESAQISIVRTFRDLQEKELIFGIPWRLPPIEVVRLEKNVPPNGFYRMAYDNGKPALEGQMKKTLRDGPWNHYYSNGVLLAVGQYQNGEKTGHWTFYYPNAKKMMSGHYTGDVKTGEWQNWDMKDNLTKTHHEKKFND